MQHIRAWIPNLFTLGNLICGMLSCWYAVMQAGLIITPEFSLADKQWSDYLPSLFIFGAAFLDFCDGFVARLLKVSSELGKQLDSLADVVSFGVAPSFILISYGWLGNSSYLGFAIGVFACVRLAKFNIDTRQGESFLGLPVPAVGILIAALPFIKLNGNLGFLLEFWPILILTAILCFLMVSEIPMLALKFKNFYVKENIWRYLVLLVSLLLLLIFKMEGLPLIILSYVLISALQRLNFLTNR